MALGVRVAMALVGLLLAVSLLVAYVNYRAGPARLLTGLAAVELSRRRSPALYRRLERLCVEMGLAVPPVLVADLGAPNALSVGGPRSSVVVLDRRLLDLLTTDELEGILAHELAHAEGYDAFVQTMAVSLLRALGGLVGVVLLPVFLLAYGFDRAMAWIRGRPARRAGLGEWLRPGAQLAVGLLLSVFTLVVLAYSRRREYTADRRATEVTDRPLALARALWKIKRATDPGRGVRSLLYIHGDEGDSLRRLFSTHPPIEERVERLVARADRPGASTRRFDI